MGYVSGCGSRDHCSFLSERRAEHRDASGQNCARGGLMHCGIHPSAPATCPSTCLAQAQGVRPDGVHRGLGGAGGGEVQRAVPVLSGHVCQGGGALACDAALNLHLPVLYACTGCACGQPAVLLSCSRGPCTQWPRRRPVPTKQRLHTAQVTEEDLDAFHESYRGGEEERGEVLKYYQQFRGDMRKVRLAPPHFGISWQLAAAFS